jgi:NOL1/NOP2/fmu family ribosome biogenesis protein
MLFGYLEERFGIPACVFDGYILLKTARSWHLFDEGGHLGQAVRLKSVQAGLKAFEQVGRFIKPTTRFIQIFGRHATRATFEIDRCNLHRLLAGERLCTDLGCGQGYVILTVTGYGVVGLGLLVGGKITSQLRSRELAGLEW